MRNPWLDIPADDYLGHMDGPGVGQLSVLGQLFGQALAKFRPRDLLLLGCTTGNGLSQIDPAVTRRVTAVDINPEYVARLRRQYPSPGFDLQVDCADLMTYPLAEAAFGLAHAALVFEYLDWTRLMPALGRTIRHGALSVVLQQPSAALPAVTPTAFTSLNRLETLFHFVDPGALAARAGECGLILESERVEPLKSGKIFDVVYFRKA